MSLTVFDEKDPGEARFVTFDFTADLGAETISTVVGVTCVTDGGVDASPASVLSGPPSTVGSLKVQQKIVGGLHGVNYRLEATVTTSGGRTLVLAAVLPVRDR